jgi:hypothetical protein
MGVSRSAMMLCAIAVAMMAAVLFAPTAVAYEAEAEPWVLEMAEHPPGMAPPPAPPSPPPDETAPDTSIGRTVAPEGRRFAKLFLESTEPESSFWCKLDQLEALECDSPQRYGHLGGGGHVVRVYAADASGNVDATPAISHFRIVQPKR